MKKLLNENTEIKLEIAAIKQHLNNHDKNIELVFSYFDELGEKKSRSKKQIGLRLSPKHATQIMYGFSTIYPKALDQMFF